MLTLSIVFDVAYLKADSKSKALWDAVKCVELAPTWSKGYNRLGTAQHSLGRYEAAIESYKKGIIFYMSRYG